MGRPTEGITVRERIFQLVVDSNTEHHRPASRQWLIQQTHLSFAVVDEHLKNLRNDGRIFADTPGYYQPVPELPSDRPISVTVLNNGMRKLELGDSVLDVTPHEWAVLGDLACGTTQRMGQRENDRQLNGDVAQLKARVKSQSGLIDELTRAVAGLQKRAQADMFAV